MIVVAKPVSLSLVLVAVKSQRADTLTLHVSRPLFVKLVVTVCYSSGAHVCCSCIGIQPRCRLAAADSGRVLGTDESAKG